MSQTANALDVRAVVKSILDSIDRDREKEIIGRRFGLYDRRETLEQIGELLGITRERVRQLEKAILARLKAQAAEDQLLQLKSAEKAIIKELHELGLVATVINLAQALTEQDDERTHAHVALLASISPGLELIDENDRYRQAVAIRDKYDERKIKQAIKQVIDAIKTVGEPITAEELHARLSLEHPRHIAALASISKELATLRGLWGLIRWPLVNPKNIRDKIYVILKDNQKPMHFSDIAKQIKASTFKRKDVTTQAIHNELIKDPRFVLIGRGIYALKEWGYKRGTVADVIAEVLKKSGKPLHRDEIVKRVLKSRRVKETTILLNLQGKPQFKRVAKATYAFDETA
ncbi:MAG TPA: sigma factor-like helix-turn-helix DNA-binding protein [Candidatus Saccharimonadales bacterium]